MGQRRAAHLGVRQESVAHSDTLGIAQSLVDVICLVKGSLDVGPQVEESGLGDS